jgi:predicted Zn-dependent peptidase
VIDAIRVEVEKLQNELVPMEELLMARNYMMGHIMTQLDGPFSSLDFIRSMKIEHLEDQVFARMITTIQELTPEGVRDLARKYLDLKDWATIVVR